MSIHFDNPSIPFTIAVVGLGKRALTRAIPAIVQLSELFQLGVGCDKDARARTKFTSTFATTDCVSTVEEVILWRDTIGNKVQCAYVAVPHSEHQSTVTCLLQAGIHVLKEKPASLSKNELLGFHQLAERHKVRLVTACQGRYATLKRGHQDMYTEISSDTHHSVNTDDNHNTCDTDDENPQPAKRRKPHIAPTVTPTICHKHTPELRHGEPSPLVALSATTPEIDDAQLQADDHQSWSIIAIIMPRELLRVRLRHQRRCHLLSLGNGPSNAFSNALRSGVR